MFSHHTRQFITFSLVIGLTLALLWLLSGVFITTSTAQAQQIDITNSLKPSTTGPTVIATVTVGAGPRSVAVNPNTNRIYVASSYGQSVSVIDGISNTVIATVPVNSYLFGIAVNPVTNRVYAGSEDSNSVFVIDGASNTIITTVTVGSSSRGIAVNPNTNRIYVTNGYSNTVSVIDGTNNTVIATIPVGAYPFGIGVNPGINRLYVSNNDSHNVSVIDGTNNSNIATVALGSAPLFGVGVNPVTNRVYVANGDGTISVIDGANNTVAATITSGFLPWGVAINSNLDRIYVTDSSATAVSVIDGESNAIIATASIRLVPLGIDVNQNTNRVYAANNGDSSVSVLQDIVWYVAPPPLGNDANDCISAATPCATIGAAIGKATTNDIIFIAAGTYTENLTVNKALRFIGAGTDSTIVDGDHTNRVFNITSGAVSIADLTVQNGSTTGDGGGIYAANALTLTNVDVLSNTATSSGGGIYNPANGSVLLINTIIAGNHVSSSGAGVENLGAMQVLSSVIANNECAIMCVGGGIANGGVLTISGSLITGNTAYDAGGINNYGTLLMSTTTVEHNIVGSSAGGLYNYGTATVLASTLIRNLSQGNGGAIYNGGTVTLTNSTISTNTANSEGGGLRNYNGVAFLNNSTIVANTADGDHNGYGYGGGIDNSGSVNTGTVSLNNTILALNVDATGQSPDCAGTMTSQGHNLIQNAVGCTINGTSDGNLIGVDPLIEPLMDNGGWTLTHALLPGSPAINAGNDVTCLPFDQRGVARPQGAHCDMGAYELVADTRYVATTGNDSGNVCLDPANPCATVQHAVDVASDNNDIRIAAGTYTENITVTIPLNFVGAGTDSTIVDGNLAGRVFNITSGAVSISGLTVQNGSIAGDGGGIYNASNLTLDHVTVMSNTASNNGGGIYNAGSLYAQDSLVHYNAASNSGCGLYNVGTAEFLSTPIEHNYEAMPIGGGIYNSGSLRIISGTVAYNSGMAYGNIWNNGGTLSLIRSTISNGSSTTPGNALANSNGGQVFVIDSQIFNNPGAIDTSNGTLVITNSTIMSNVSSYTGAGINAYNSTVVITNSTLSGNIANSGHGGGLSSEGSTVDLYNVTIANNTAADYGSGASGGGLYVWSGTVNAWNTIIAGNHDGGSGTLHPDCSGTVASHGYNLIGDTTGCTLSGTLTGVITNTLPLLGNLQDNGGPAWTMALLTDSPAIDAGDDTTCPAIDQRGVARPQGAHCDMGAYEYQSTQISYTLTIATVGNGSGAVTTDPSGPLYLSGTVVTLTATPLISSTFTGWSGDVITSTNPVTLTMDTNKSVTATFALNTYLITPTAGVNGSITPATPQTVNYGASQTFTITANTDYHIADVGVDGISQGPISLYTFDNVTTHHTITATFAINTYTLTLNYAGNGIGSVIVEPPGPGYTAGTVVTLTAVPSTTSRFTDWSGDMISTTNPVVLIMDGDKAITATFITYRVYLPLITR